MAVVSMAAAGIGIAFSAVLGISGCVMQSVLRNHDDDESEQ